MNRQELKDTLSHLLCEAGNGLSIMEALMIKMKTIIEKLYPTRAEFEVDHKWIIGEIKKGLSLADRLIITDYEEAKTDKAIQIKAGVSLSLDYLTLFNDKKHNFNKLSARIYYLKKQLMDSFYGVEAKDDVLPLADDGAMNADLVVVRPTSPCK